MPVQIFCLYIQYSMVAKECKKKKQTNETRLEKKEQKIRYLGYYCGERSFVYVLRHEDERYPWKGQTNGMDGWFPSSKRCPGDYQAFPEVARTAVTVLNLWVVSCLEGGPRASTRRVLMSIIHSTLLYGTEVWADALNKMAYRKRIARV
uniref:SH3 domain-containing protein n=1 Tax=Rhodnius prolixus TaxID=13249 RepID=T1HQD3_RHOPR